MQQFYGRDPKKTLEAAKAMKLSAKDLLNLRIIDEIISEPIGGAHRDKDLVLENVKNSIINNLQEFKSMDREEIINHRKTKFLSIGRNKGFINQAADKDTLSMNQSFADNVINKIYNYKNLTISIILLIIFSIIVFYLL